ncbi:MAG: adenylate kinase [Chloroflexota bacterium]
MFIVLLGPPGAGKGTQAKVVSKTLNVPHISSGDIFRENFNNQTSLGKVAQGYIQRGELVPDDITIAMVRDRLSKPDCAQGAILDGFPRTTAQAKALDNLLEEFSHAVDVVCYMKVPQAVLLERLTGRWTCREKGHIYHERNNPPKQRGLCDIDGSELYQREDDQVETVKRRIQVYFEQTAPLITYYQDRGLLVEVDGARSVGQVTDQLLTIAKRVQRKDDGA